MNSIPNNRSPIPGTTQAGFSLLEVLVALVVLSIGLLGVAALQTYSVKYNHQSYQRTQSVILSDAIVDRMRANPDAVNAGTFTIPYGTPASSYTPAAGCPATCASATDLATYDIFQWLSTIAAPGMLTNGRAGITTDGTRHTITITWQENDIEMRQEMIVQLF